MGSVEEKQFFGDETINRVSFLRADDAYIQQIVSFSGSKFVFYTGAGMAPLVSKETSVPLIKTFGDLPTHFQKLLQQWGIANAAKSIDLLNLGFKAVFLGIDETGSFNAGQEAKVFNYKDKYIGTPIFAVYVNDEILTSLEFEGVEPLEQVLDYLKLDNKYASLVSYGKMYTDWLSKYKFCPGCASQMVPVDAGTRLFCLSASEAKCPIKSARVNNVCFPRTDPVVITCVVSSKGDKVLLGLNKRNLKGMRKMYSCIAGFMEPSETIELATVREVWEETGCQVSELYIQNSQPWPFPVNLMIGCIAVVEFNGKDEVINLGHDAELADARWFTIAELEKLIANEPHPEGITVPMPKSIANSLINSVVNKTYKH